MLEKVKEIITDFPTWEKYKSLKEDWTSQNELIDRQKAQLNSRDRKIISLENEQMKLYESTEKALQKWNGKLLKTELARKKSAGKVGGLTKEINKLKNEKEKLADIIEKLQRQNNWLRRRIPKPTAESLTKYEMRRGKSNAIIDIGINSTSTNGS